MRATRGGNGDTYLLASRRCPATERWSTTIISLAGKAAADRRWQCQGTRARPAPEGYHLSRCNITKLYLARDRGDENPANFEQINIDPQQERVHCVLLRSYLLDEWRTLSDLVELAEGDALPDEQRVAVGATH